jgi:hypothetical protein
MVIRKSIMIIWKWYNSFSCKNLKFFLTTEKNDLKAIIYLWINYFKRVSVIKNTYVIIKTPEDTKFLY